MSYCGIPFVIAFCLIMALLSTVRTFSVASNESFLSVLSRGIFAKGSTTKFHSGPYLCGLMEFFDIDKHWGEVEVKTGRPWRLDELRLKSNSDIHKLWYVLLKERNMLLTMEHEYKRRLELFPNPERIWKVEESMRNILDIFAERNRAVNLLETGKTGEPEKERIQNELGLLAWHRKREWHLPEWLNRSFTKIPWYAPVHKEISAMHRLLLEKEMAKKRRVQKQIAARVAMLRRKFPEAKPDACQKAAEQEITNKYKPVWEVDPPI